MTLVQWCSCFLISGSSAVRQRTFLVTAAGHLYLSLPLQHSLSQYTSAENDAPSHRAGGALLFQSHF